MLQIPCALQQLLLHFQAPCTLRSTLPMHSRPLSVLASPGPIGVASSGGHCTMPSSLRQDAAVHAEADTQHRRSQHPVIDALPSCLHYNCNAGLPVKIKSGGDLASAGLVQ